METVIRPFAMQGKETAGWLVAHILAVNILFVHTFWRYFVFRRRKKATMLIFVWRSDSVHAAS
jgi:hypothetical protein